MKLSLWEWEQCSYERIVGFKARFLAMAAELKKK